MDCWYRWHLIPKNLDHFESFFKKDIPLVFFDRTIFHAKTISILINNVEAAYNATNHLIEQGCKRIIYIIAPSN